MFLLLSLLSQTTGSSLCRRTWKEWRRKVLTWWSLVARWTTLCWTHSNIIEVLTVNNHSVKQQRLTACYSLFKSKPQAYFCKHMLSSQSAVITHCFGCALLCSVVWCLTCVPPEGIKGRWYCKRSSARRNSQTAQRGNSAQTGE